MTDLETLRQKRQNEIMSQTEHLYHFSQIPPTEFGDFLLIHPQERGNALCEKVGESLCYASTEAQSHYIIKPPSNNPSEYSGVSCYMDEKAVLITGHDPKEFLSKQPAQQKPLEKPHQPIILDNALIRQRGDNSRG